MYKIQINVLFKIIIFFILINITIPLFCENDNTTDDEKMNNFFSFYLKEKYTIEADNENIYTNFLKNELNFDFNFPFNFYKLNFWLNNSFNGDFNQIQILKSYEIRDSSVITGNILDNFLRLGIENKFKIFNIMKLIIGSETGLLTPFYSDIIILINPLILNLNDKYFFGLDWEIEQSIPIEITPGINNYTISSLTYLKISFELFRFYGPENFKIIFLIDDYLSLPIYDNISLPDFENYFTAGIYLSFFGVIPSFYFIMNTYGNTYDRIMYANYIGFKTGILYTIKWFIFSIDYSGYFDILNQSSNWINNVEIFIKFQI